MELEVFCRQPAGLKPVGRLVPGEVLAGCEELGQYQIPVGSPDWKLYVDDAPLPLDPSGRFWAWSPGFYAGEVLVELEQPGRHEPLRYYLDVSPSQAKTGRAQYAEYIEQILDYEPRLLLGSEPATADVGGRSRAGAPVWVRFARVRSFIEAYLSGLKAICDRPLVRNRYHREQVPVYMARRVDLGTVRGLRHNPALMAAVAGMGNGDGGSSVFNERLDVPFHEPTLDHPANRVMASQLGEVRRLVNSLLLQMQAQTARQGETETDLYSRMPRRLAFLRTVSKALLRFSRTEPFVSVSDRQPGVAGVNSILGTPHYGMTHRLGIRILRDGVSGSATDEKHYLAPTWQVYESWCFVALANALESFRSDYQWSLKASPAWADMMLEGSNGASTLRFFSQLVCPSLEQQNGYGYLSVSRERRPDFVLEYTDDEGTRFLCLDSKYRVSREALLDAMASAHVYRDSIRKDGNPPLASLLITPGAGQVALLASDEYLARNQAGCVSLRETAQAVDVAKRLLAMLGA